jgi:orotidine-5'-phosphate decarboxylase
MTDRAPIAVALDTADLGTATSWAAAVAPVVQALKVGLQLFCSEGPSAVEKVRTAADLELFLDLKLSDIPATVAGAARSLVPLAPTYLTVHASAGPAAIEAAATALPNTRIAGVTILTSLSAADLDLLGIVGPPEVAVRRLARIAVDAGARALVCSPQEVAAVRDEVGADIVLITPGIRPAGADAQDQSRISTPQSALAAGADLLVVGRPITGASDVSEAAANLAAQLRD